VPTIQAAGYAVPRAASVDTPEIAPQYQNIPTTADMFGASIGQALSQFGQQAERASDRLDTIQKQYDDVTAREARNRAEAQAQRLLYGDPDKPEDTGYFGLQGRASLDQRKATLMQLNKFYEDERKNLPTQEAVRRFDEGSSQRRLHNDAMVLQHSSQQFQQYRDKEFKAETELRMNNVAGASTRGNKADFDQSLGEALQATEQGMRARNASQAEIDEKKAELTSTAVTFWANGIAPSDPQLALRTLEENKEHFRDPARYAELHSRLKAQADKVAARDLVKSTATAPTVGDGAGIPFGPGNPGSVAMTHSPEVQEQVAKTIATTSGLQHWGGIDPRTGKPWNPKLRAEFEAAGLPLSGPVSDAQWETAKPMILRLESEGGKNIPTATFSTAPGGSTAGGPFQITNSTWRNFGGPEPGAAPVATPAAPGTAAPAAGAPAPPPGTSAEGNWRPATKEELAGARPVPASLDPKVKWVYEDKTGKEVVARPRMTADGRLITLGPNGVPGITEYRPEGGAAPAPTTAAAVPGMIAPGNIDLAKRPVVKNPDGSISTVRSMSINVDGNEVLIPTVAADGSRILSNEEAIAQYKRTGQMLGIFDTPANATAYAQQLHDQQAKAYAPGATAPAVPGAPAPPAAPGAAALTVAGGAPAVPGATAPAVAGAPAVSPAQGIPESPLAAQVARINASNASPEVKEAAIAELHKQHSATALGQDQAKYELEKAITRGDAAVTPEYIDSLVKGGKIAPAAGTSALDYLAKVQAQKEAEREALRKVNEAGAGGTPLDPKNEYDRKALNYHYEVASSLWPAQQALDRSVAYATQYGLVPDKLKAAIRGGLHSGQPDRAMLAADTVARLRNANPSLVGELGDENDLRLANQINSYTSAGVSPQHALELVTESMKATGAEKEARKDDFEAQRGKTVKERTDNDDRWIARQQNSLWVHDPNVDPTMRQEFVEVSKAEFERTGNLEAARRTALDQINRVWGRSDVGGDRRYMKFAPEKFYPVPGLSPSENTNWMKEQLLGDMATNALQDPDNPITPERIRLLPDPTRSAAGLPVYQVWLVRPDAAWQHVVDANGKPVLWKPDWNTSAERQRRAAAQQQEVETARQLRQEQIERERAIPY